MWEHRILYIRKKRNPESAPKFETLFARTTTPPNNSPTDSQSDSSSESHPIPPKIEILFAKTTNPKNTLIMSQYTITELENHLAQKRQEIEDLMTKIKTFKIDAKDWEQRKSLYWLSWLENQDCDAYDYLMKTIHKTLLFDDVKIRPYTSGWGDLDWVKNPITSTCVASGDDALKMTKWGLKLVDLPFNYREKYDAEKGHKLGVNLGWGEAVDGFVNQSSRIVDGLYWGTEDGAMDLDGSREASRFFQNLSQVVRMRRRLKDCGRFNPLVRPNGLAIAIQRSQDFKGPSFDGLNGDDINDRIIDQIPQMVVVSADEKAKIDEEYNLTRWDDAWRWSGVNLGGIRFNPKMNKDVQGRMTSGGSGWHDRSFLRHELFLPCSAEFSQKGLVDRALKNGIYVAKSWSKGKILQAMYRGNQFARHRFHPHGWTAIA